jgi:hypothetical protein
MCVAEHGCLDFRRLDFAGVCALLFALKRLLHAREVRVCYLDCYDSVVDWYAYEHVGTVRGIGDGVLHVCKAALEGESDDFDPARGTHLCSKRNAIEMGSDPLLADVTNGALSTEIFSG